MLFENEFLIEDLIANPKVIGVIYVTENLVNHKVYIGQQGISGKTLKSIKKYLGSGTVLNKALQKYGRTSFQKHYVDFAEDKASLNKKEIDWIERNKARDRNIGYNVQAGGYHEGLEHTSCIWVTNGSENLQIAKDQVAAYLALGYKKGTNLRGNVCFVNDGMSERRIYNTDLNDYLSRGFTPGRILGREYVEKVWAHYQNRMPSRMGKDSVPKEFSVIPDCPVCHAPNSADNFCCSDEHWDEFERLRKEAMSRAQSEFVSSSWKDESVAEARKAGVSSAFAKRREMREAGELDAYVWVKNDSLGVESQVPESDVSEYEESGYVRGRLGFSAEARANMGRDAGFSWSEESLRKREETRQKLHEERMKDPKYVKEQHELRSVGQLKASEKKKGTWANKEMSDEWKRMKSETTKAGFAAKKAERLAKGECVTKKWVHRGTKSMRVLGTEYEAKLTEGWEPGRGKLKGC